MAYHTYGITEKWVVGGVPVEPGSRLTYHLRKHQRGTLSTFELRVCNGGTIDVSLQ